MDLGGNEKEGGGQTVVVRRWWVGGIIADAGHGERVDAVADLSGKREERS